MKCITISLLTFFSLIHSVVSQQSDPIDNGLKAITKESVQAQMEFLASDWTEGRATGTKGAYLAADYIASMFKVYGIQPAGDDAWTQPDKLDRWNGIEAKKYRSYFQNFQMVKYAPDKQQEFALINNKGKVKEQINFSYKTDFSVYTSTTGKMAEAPIVFVGYGYVDKEKNYNDYQGINIKGKIVLRLKGFPGHADTTSIGYKKFKRKEWTDWYSIYEQQRDYLLKNGAIAVIEYNSEESIENDFATNKRFHYKEWCYKGGKKPASYYENRMELMDDSLSSYSLEIINITKRVMDEILNGTGINIKSFENTVKNTLKPQSKDIKGKQVYFKTSVKSEILNVRNVVGVIEGEDTNSVIVLGAHYDHLGKHDGYIWNGADDNASGTVGIMTLAKAITATGVKSKKTIVFAAWTGEEEGLFGSKYFTQHPYKPLSNIKMVLNYDMISRNSKKDSLSKGVSLHYSQGYEKLKEMTDEFNKKYELGLDLKFEKDEFLYYSDHTYFAENDIPFIYFMAGGWHIDFHQPTDELSKISWDKLTKIIKLGFLDVWEIANSDDKLVKTK